MRKIKICKKIIFKGKEYWLKDEFVISPLNHFNDDGTFNYKNVIKDNFTGFAIIQGDDIYRFGKVIGSLKKDITFIEGDK